MAQYFVGLPLTYFGIRGEFLLVLHHWAFQKFRWRFNQCFPGAKRLLSSKKILAWILKYCVPEFENCEIADIRDKYIEGTPEVGTVPALPDETNAARIVGDNVEDKMLTEGTVTYDIRFRAITPEKDSLGLIINIEAQHSANLEYPLTKRAFYYCSRLISAQHDMVFAKSEYGKIKKVYSI